jgi:hypothetical protein
MQPQLFLEYLYSIGYAQKQDSITRSSSPMYQNIPSKNNVEFLNIESKYTLILPTDAIPPIKTPHYFYPQDPYLKITHYFKRFIECLQTALTGPDGDFARAMLYLETYIKLIKGLSDGTSFFKPAFDYEIIKATDGTLYLVTEASDIEKIREKKAKNEYINHKNYSTHKILSAESVEGDSRENVPFDGIDYNESYTLERQLQIIKEGIKNINGYVCIVRESRGGGGLDFKRFFYSGELINLNGLYMNDHEALNYMWGAALNELKETGKVNVTLFEALGGAQAYHVYDSQIKKDGRSKGWDNQDNHDEAIRQGWKFNEERWKEKRRNIQIQDTTKFNLDMLFLKDRVIMRDNKTIYYY